MTRQPLLERAALNAIRSNTLASTNEIVRVLVRGGTKTSRTSVTRALKVLEGDGLITRLGDDAACWQAV